MPTLLLHATDDEIDARLAELEAQKRPCTECARVTNRAGYLAAGYDHVCECCWEAVCDRLFPLPEDFPF